MKLSPDHVADLVLKTFDSLPSKGKPRPVENGRREWIPLSGIVLSDSTEDRVDCVALGTGMKCLPRSKIPNANGVILHDWHAEIVAIRAFNRYLLDECATLISDPCKSSSFMVRRTSSETTESEYQPFAVRDDVSIYMYCSEAPCGDASMELIMDAQEDATPWVLPDQSGSSGEAEQLRGRGHFSELGVVRRKPARADAPAAWSKSCSDKMSLKQCISLLGTTASLLISPKNAYIQELVLPISQRNVAGVERAFSRSGRMAPAVKELDFNQSDTFHFRPFSISGTSREFQFSRRSAQEGEQITPCNVSSVYTPYAQETLINGALQGRRQGDPKGASMICRYKMWHRANDLAARIREPVQTQLDSSMNYQQFKIQQVFAERSKVKYAVQKSALRGWQPNSGDDKFNLVGQGKDFIDNRASPAN